MNRKPLHLKADESGHQPFDAETLSERRRYSRLLLKLTERWRDAQVRRGKEGESDHMTIATMREELEEMRLIISNNITSSKEAASPVQVTRV